MDLPVSALGHQHLQQHPEDLAELLAVATDFRRFLDHWHFLDQETGQIKVLGEVLWEAQEVFVRAVHDDKWVFVLKARKLGETTIETAYDGWCLRFRDRNARVHLFSRRDKAAQEILKAVKFGLERMPEYMRLPVQRSTTEEYELAAGPDDRRLCVAYPADQDTAVESTCTHGHVDEWARMGNPRRVWQAIEPTMAGSCHFVTTGMGPANYTSNYWRKCLAGDARHRAIFIGALNRPDRDEAWYAAKRREMTELELKHEYPMNWQDALSGGGEFVFEPEELDEAGVDFRGLGPAREGRSYVKGVDIGRHKDACVIVVLDVTEPVWDVVHYRRMRGARYPTMQHAIEVVHEDYPGVTAIEDNSAGEAVRENLTCPEHEVVGFKTQAASKGRIISKTKVRLQNQELKWDASACEQLDDEMRGYQIPDTNVVQDSVMALAIAVEHGDAVVVGGRLLGGVQTW